MPWDDERLAAVEAEAATCPNGDACAEDVISLIAEVRRLRAVSRPEFCRCGRPAFYSFRSPSPRCPGCEYMASETCDCAPEKPRTTTAECHLSRLEP